MFEQANVFENVQMFIRIHCVNDEIIGTQTMRYQTWMVRAQHAIPNTLGSLLIFLQHHLCLNLTLRNTRAPARLLSQFTIVHSNFVYISQIDYIEHHNIHGAQVIFSRLRFDSEIEKKKNGHAPIKMSMFLFWPIKIKGVRINCVLLESELELKLEGSLNIATR